MKGGGAWRPIRKRPGSSSSRKIDRAAQHIHRIRGGARPSARRFHFQKIVISETWNAGPLQPEIDPVQHRRNAIGISRPGFNIQTTAAYRMWPGANSRMMHEGGGSAATSGIGEARSARRHRIDQLLRIGRVRHRERYELPARSGSTITGRSGQNAVGHHDEVAVRRLDRGVPQPDMLDPARRIRRI